MKFSILSIVGILLLQSSLVRAETRVHRLRVSLDAETQRLVTDSAEAALSQPEQACLTAQTTAIQSQLQKLPGDVQVSYEVVSSQSKKLDDSRFLKDKTVMGPFQGLIRYPGLDKAHTIFHVPVVVYSDGRCETMKAQWADSELSELKEVAQADPAVNTAHREISRR
jgi:hypothetical protein